MKRHEHIRWSKDRALEYLKNNDIQGAFTSMISDIVKHPETSYHIETNKLGVILLMNGSLDTVDEMRKWINGYC
jgi:hypothetical protein